MKRKKIEKSQYGLSWVTNFIGYLSTILNIYVLLQFENVIAFLILLLSIHQENVRSDGTLVTTNDPTDALRNLKSKMHAS